ncbi:hypothetical protein ACQKLX_07305 [Bosea sp. NPDC003192]|uniref:hypothetical protein n=1 Tax=Bosea sp. NPDC003192 TaxID=3390551 RepID=UPI003D0763FF
MDRLTRGFHRIGLVGAVPAVLTAVGFLIAGIASGSLTSNGEGGMAVFCIVVAGLWYAGCRAFAWVINGFRETA